ncbi:Uncharacterised protein [Rhodococcus erythropolis]|uniref:hypothetical protein n=1 Tax=Rhodococcus erythropolis TaxID=1833 RepID=UPI000BB30E4F|nr:hypothetical protein [Rhodococcus erythropolis]PBI91151.1 hypothetical protein BKP42_55030 [Rhodococcus erythropolis]SUH12190.1 Uncharacterised protein [Rhodococcus erythropolis]
MSYEHSNVYIVRIVETDAAGDIKTWFAGPYGSTRADQTADHLESIVAEDTNRTRECYVEPLFSDDECLRVADYDRKTHRSLK